MKTKFPLHIHISTLFLVLILLVGGIIAGVGFELSRETMQMSAQDLITRIGDDTGDEVSSVIVPAELSVGLISHSSLILAKDFNERFQRIGMLRTALERTPAAAGIYVGYANGDFFSIRPVRTEADRQALSAPEGAQYFVQSIANGEGRFVYLDKDLQVLRFELRPEYAKAYDPRTRPWFIDARQTQGLIRTAPYLFFTAMSKRHAIGITVATPGHASNHVVGVDISLEELAANLKRRKPSTGSEMALVNANNVVLAHEDPKQMVVEASASGQQPRLRRLNEYLSAPLSAAAAMLGRFDGRHAISQRLQLDDKVWQLSIVPLSVLDVHDLYMVVAMPEDELLADALRLRRTSMWSILVIMLVVIPITWLLAQKIAKPLRLLHGEAERIRRFDFSGEQRVKSLVTEVEELSEAMFDVKRALRRFMDISRSVEAESDIDKLMPLILSETLAAAQAEKGILYLYDHQSLQATVVVDKLGQQLACQIPTLTEGNYPHMLNEGVRLAFYSEALSPADREILGLTLRDFPANLQHGIVLPLRNRQHDLIGAIVLLRETAIEQAQLAFISNLAVSAASALETRELIKAQKQLFEAFITLIASAIDAKSPYTGGHCARVPELTKMLAQAACAQQQGPYREFNLTAEQWEAVHIGAWLHDCGKVTTPEYVVDKATKLETLYDRIHEIRMRFEVLKRDAEIATLQRQLAGEDPAQLQQQLAEQLAQLDEEFRFVATCNEGGEFMAKEKQERLQQIAQRSWWRTLDDNLGISHEEKARKQAQPAQSLPILEALLADKPEHRFVRPDNEKIPATNPWGFKMTVPELLYNKGELYNLSVARGTLSEEERYKINQHIVQTIIMLEKLPFPKHLRDVPEIAGGHHEKMDGTGYPKRLLKEQMSPVARMMAIADIFEALTAVDRPYKKGKTLSEAIKIMSFMKKDQHIDGDLFELFLQSGVYLRYAEKYMRPEQIDELDLSQYVTQSAPKVEGSLNSADSRQPTMVPA